MPWELGRCSLKAGDRHVDVRNVVWIGTSNVGHDTVFEFEPTSRGSDGSMSRADYVKLTDLLRPKVSERLGVSDDVVPAGQRLLIMIHHHTGLSRFARYLRATLRPFYAR